MFLAVLHPAESTATQTRCSSALIPSNTQLPPLQIEAQANEHENLKVDGFPGIFLYPSGKDKTPITYSGYDRSLKVHQQSKIWM